MSKNKDQSKNDLENSPLNKALINHQDDEEVPKPNEDYDPDQTPADIEKAKKHGKAKRIYKFDEGKKPKGKLCPCCGLPEAGGELIPLTCDPSELYHIGSGYVLYFTFFKHCIGMLLTMLFVSGIYNMYTNWDSQDCTEPETIDIITEDLCCTRGLFSNLSLASKKDHPDQMAFQIQLNLLTIIALIIYCQSVRYKMRKMNEEVAETKTTPADYTIMFLELPIDPNHELSSDEGLKKWLEGMAKPDQPVHVKKIVRSYDVAEYKACMEKKEKVDDKLKKGRLSQKNAEMKQRKLSEQIKEMENTGFKLTGIAFVSFNDVNEVEYVRKQFKKNFIMEILFKAKRILFLFYWGNLPFSFDNIEAKKAPEPTDIEWDNLSYHIVNKLRRRFVISFIMYTIVAIDFFIILQINIQFKGLSFVPGAPYATAVNQFLNYVSSSIIVCLDIILEKICLYLNSWEMHYSKSNFSKNAATRIAFYTALNLIVPVLMANIGNAFYDSLYPTLMGEKATVSIPWTIYGDGGMISTMVFVFWFEAFKNFGLNLFDPFYYLKIAQQKKAILTKGKGLTQAQAHEIFEGPGADMERRHGGLVASMILTSCYAACLPVSLLFTIVSITLNYWSDKYIFFRRMVLPNAIGPQITNRSLQDLETIVLVFTAGNVFFTYNIKSKVESQVLDIITNYSFKIMVGIAVLYKFILPVDWLNQLLFPVKKRFVLKGTYDQAKLKFLTDFDIENPVTRSQAIEELRKQSLKVKTPKPGDRSPNMGFAIHNTHEQELKVIKRKSMPGSEERFEL